ncbi:glycerol-3-phosphate acyltransferase [Mesobacillus foraminis]|uniref:glycerol-3-phosphate acyltransferase n=1 Tax=Mesobacillus foraminis TaxID=279826 RepID=UPI001BE6AE1E|nr:glycerol-3-phosphate acyltransferase [Mesobacillus foraminis]MBT2755437.1 glycerol-3-phosphate acyltransferase [Mesobacillus foraminis]
MNVFIYLMAAYIVGNFISGYFVLKIFAKKDIREEGSGNAGARNAGRIYGKKAFILTFFGDALKGAIVIWAGRAFGLPGDILLLGLGAAVLGHIKPVCFGFKGGKGISAFIGGILAYEPFTALIIIGGFLLLYPFAKSFTVAGLGAFLFIPAFFVWSMETGMAIFAVLLLILGLILAHKDNIIERLGHHDGNK